MTRTMTHHRTSRAVAGVALAATLGLGLTACGDEAPEAGSAPTETTSDDGAAGSAAPEPAEEETAETVTETVTESAAPAPPPEETETATETETVSASAPADGDGVRGGAVVQEYTEKLAGGNAEEAHAMLSEESKSYFPAPDGLLDSPEMAEMIEDIAGSQDVLFHSRPAFEEAHDGAEAVTAWGTNGDGETFAYGWAVRYDDDGAGPVVLDQDRFEVSTGIGRISWMNPGSVYEDDPTLINSEQPLSFALLKESNPEIAAVNASIDDGDLLTGDDLNELPTDGAQQYEVIGFDVTSLDPNAPHGMTVAWVAEDAPFVHVQSTGMVYSPDHG